MFPFPTECPQQRLGSEEMDLGGGGEFAIFTANVFTACGSGGKRGASAANTGAAEPQQEGVQAQLCTV